MIYAVHDVENSISLGVSTYLNDLAGNIWPHMIAHSEERAEFEGRMAYADLSETFNCHVVALLGSGNVLTLVVSDPVGATLASFHLNESKMFMDNCQSFSCKF